MKMAEEWSQQQQDEFTSLYKRFQDGVDYNRYKPIVDKKLFGGDMLPYEDAKSILTRAIESQQHESQQHEAQRGGLEERVGEGIPFKEVQPRTPMDFAVYLGAFAMILLYIAL